MVDSVGHKGGLALLWKDDVDVQVQSYSTNHVDALVKTDGLGRIKFFGFYNYPKLNQRHLSWDILRNIGRNVNED